MSDEEFLARWSRRKQEARSGNPAPEPAEPMEAHDPAPPPGTADDVPNPDVDPSSLPPIESIDAATDITAFLRKGIPQELSRAALRRAWTADPAIRDFVGLAENAWDFNDPNAMPGFGPLDCSAVQLNALVDRVVGGVQQVTEQLADPPAAAENMGRFAAPEHDPAPIDVQESNSDAIAGLPATDQAMSPEALPTPAAPQPATATKTESEEAPVRHRTHGGALPR
jgi:hypothetical protein